MTKFSELGLDPIIVNTVEKLGFDKPTQIQEEAIPLVLAGHDVMGLAQTGTGKTAAFGLPLVDHLLKLRKKPAARAVHSLVLVPTRELANQIDENLRRYVYGTSLKVNVVVGGSNIQNQQRKLERGTDVLIATPGRLLDLVKRRSLKLDEAQFLVLDEADQMLDLGFIHALRQIAPLLAKPRQTLLFSATMPKQMAELSRSYLNDPVRVETAPAGRAADKVAQTVYFVEQRAKSDLLVRCLSERPNDLSIVFGRTKHGCEKLMNRLCDMGFAAVSVHGNKSQGQRERAIRQFKEFKANILVATDVAARGIDIPGVSHVYNYDLPEVPENYVHRIGRTARAGKEGLAVAFCAGSEKRLLQSIERLMKMKVKVANAADLPQAPKVKKPGAANAQAAEGRDGFNGSRDYKDPRAGRGERGAPRGGAPRGGERGGSRSEGGYKGKSDRGAPKRGKPSWSENRADHRADHLMTEEAPAENQDRNFEPRRPKAKSPEQKQRWTASKKLEKRKIEASRTKSKKHIDQRHERDSENWDDARAVETGGERGRSHRTSDGMGPRARTGGGRKPAGNGGYGNRDSRGGNRSEYRGGGNRGDNRNDSRGNRDGAPQARNDNRKREDSRDNRTTRSDDGFANKKNFSGKPRKPSNGGGYKGNGNAEGGYKARGNSGDRPSPQKRRRTVTKQAR